MKQPALSIVIPAFQEASRIEHTLEELAAFLRRHKYDDTEVVVAVADSPDGTADLARSKSKLFNDFRVVETGPQVGKGRDVRAGIMETRGAYKLFMDADLATPLYHIQRVRELMAEGAEVIIAVRNLQDSHRGFRKLLSGAGNWLVRILLLPGIMDTQCGFKAFKAEVAEELFGRQTILGWGFDMEILAIARLRKYRIAQIEVHDWVDKPDGTFEGAMTSAAFQTLAELGLILWRSLTGRYRNKTFTYEAHRR